MMHALVVGGTGMLAAVTRHLATKAEAVSLLARRPERVTGPRISPLAVDYNDLPGLRLGIQQAIAAHGPVVLVVVWLSDAVPGVLEQIAAEVAKPGLPFRLVVVRGSRAADPNSVPGKALSALPPNCHYAEVILGFVIEGATSRWLTHGEIGAGVIEAVEADQVESVVGVVRPWSMRP